MPLLAVTQTTNSGTFSGLRSLDAEIPVSTEYCAMRSAGGNHVIGVLGGNDARYYRAVQLE